MSHQLWTTLIRHSLSPNQIYLLSCYKDNIKPSKIINEELENQKCQEAQLIDNQGNLTNKASLILNEFEMFLVKTKKKVTSEVLGPGFTEKIQEYREIFPSKRLPSGQLARQSVEELKQKFIWFFKTYPEYDWELILDAADYYNAVFEKKGYMYMATSSYFIKKTDPITKEVSSKLADYCQEILDNPKILESL